ncbi:MAG: dTDP-glucose 4,6-dehydratase, partial [Chlamydiota bacterium]
MKRNVQNLIVTGGCGFMGSAFIRYLLKNPSFNGKIVNLDLLTYAGNLDNVIEIADDPRYAFVQGDIRDKILILSLCERYSIDTIVHFAAETHVDRSIDNPLAFVETNVNGTVSLLEVVKEKKNIHFHQISTDEVYGSLGEWGFFTEDSHYLPNSPYSAAKAAGDHFVRAYHKTYGISTTLSHSSNNYGPYQFPEKLLPLMISRCLERKPLPVYGNGKNVRDWLFVDDHAEAVYAIITRGKSGEVYDIGGGNERTNLEFISLLIDILSDLLNEPKESFNSLIEFVKDRPGHDYRYAIDSSKLQKELFWKPHH